MCGDKFHISKAKIFKERCDLDIYFGILGKLIGIGNYEKTRMKKCVILEMYK